MNTPVQHLFIGKRTPPHTFRCGVFTLFSGSVGVLAESQCPQHPLAERRYSGMSGWESRMNDSEGGAKQDREGTVSNSVSNDERPNVATARIESESQRSHEPMSVRRELSAAQREQRRRAPAKHGGTSADPRRLFADSTVRSRVRVLFATVPSLSDWADDGNGGQVRRPLERLRGPVRRYVVSDLIWWRMAAQFIASGDLNASLGDRLRQWATKIEAMEQALGIVPERGRRGALDPAGDIWSAP